MLFEDTVRKIYNFIRQGTNYISFKLKNRYDKFFNGQKKKESFGSYYTILLA